MYTSNMAEQQHNSFREKWAFPSEVKEALGARRYEIKPTLQTYRSGRAKWLVRFYDGDILLAARDAMELTSKRTGTPYHVCLRHEPVKRAEPAAHDSKGTD